MRTVRSTRFRDVLFPLFSFLVLLSHVPGAECARECRLERVSLGEDELSPGNLTEKLVREFEKKLGCPDGTELIQLRLNEFCVDVAGCSLSYSKVLSKTYSSSEMEDNIVYNTLLEGLLEVQHLSNRRVREIYRSAVRALQMTSALISAAQPWFFLTSVGNPRVLFQSLSTTLLMSEVEEILARRCPEMFQQTFYEECLALNRSDCEPDRGFRFRFELCMNGAFERERPELRDLRIYEGEVQANAMNASILRHFIVIHLLGADSNRYESALHEKEGRIESVITQMADSIDCSKTEKKYGALLRRATELVDEAAQIIAEETIKIGVKRQGPSVERSHQRSVDPFMYITVVCRRGNRVPHCRDLKTALLLKALIEEGPGRPADSSDPQQPFRELFRRVYEICGASCNIRQVIRMFMMLRQSVIPTITASSVPLENDMPVECLPI